MKALIIALIVSTAGCATVTVTPVQNKTGSHGKQLTVNDSGVRFYRPALHVWITESLPPDKINVVTQKETITSPNTNDISTTTAEEFKPDNARSSGGTIKSRSTEATNTQKSGVSTETMKSTTVSTMGKVYAAKFVMLPDYSQEYVVEWNAGFGSVTPNFTLTDGWNLTGFASTIDSKTSEFVTSLATAGGAGLVAGGAFKGPGLYRMNIDNAGKLSLGELVMPLN